MPVLTKQIGNFIVIHSSNHAEHRVHVLDRSQGDRIVLKLAGASTDCFHSISSETMSLLDDLLDGKKAYSENQHPLSFVWQYRLRLQNRVVWPNTNTKENVCLT